MDESTIKADIWKHVEQLPIDLQRRVLDFAKALASSTPQGVQGKSLMQFSGIISPKEADRWRMAIDDA